ncbi:MAG: hypothetical protein IMY86_10865 [Chloroflexi bacterium]|nr:hypothetical protein [Chloroflexota bacterium]
MADMDLSTPGMIAVFLLIGTVCACNIVAVGKHGKLLEYFGEHHPDKIEHIRRKRVLGIFYPSGSGRNVYQFARDHEPLGDEEAERLLADYARFIRLSTVIAVGASAFTALFILSSISGMYK